MRRILLCLVPAVLASNAPCSHASSASNASMALSEASALSLEGASALVGGVAVGTHYVLVSLKPLGKGVLAVFEAAGTSTRISLELSAEVVRGVGMHVGDAVEVVAMSGGQALMLAGSMIAFVPEELARSLHHRQRLSP